MSQNTIKPWHEVAPHLSQVALGKAPADLVITNVQWVNVQSREIIPDTDIAIAEGRFAYCGPNAKHCVGTDTEMLNGEGKYIIPGFCDAHMHIESGMLTPARFTEAVAPHGTTTLFADPHEMANVLGLEGIRLMYNEAVLQPINIYLQVPSCVPSFPGFEDAGSELNVADIAGFIDQPNIIGLGEMMDFLGVIYGDSKLFGEMAVTRLVGKTIGGHYPSPDLGNHFHAYLAGGPADDHEGTREIDAIERVRRGMRTMLRLGSAWYDVEKQITAVTEKGLDPRNFILCTDDCDAATLLHDGHMDRVVRHAIECGCEPLVALQMATINTATHFGLERELGSISPGRRADFILTGDLTELPIDLVYAYGKKVGEEGQFVGTPMPLDWPAGMKQTVRVKQPIDASQFEINPPRGDNSATLKTHVIGIIENQAPTKLLEIDLDVKDGLVEGDEDKNVCQIALVERHKSSGTVINGFVSGFGYKGNMALASTIGHDSHHMIVVGTSRDDMALAANKLIQTNGGITLWRDGQQKGLVELPIAGLLSDAPPSEVARDLIQLRNEMVNCGCNLNNAFMQHTLLALLVIPEIRISNKGIFDVTKAEFVDLFIK
ncbi:MAG: adenine deaminase [Paracoccaceae bacterium]|nr:adenine deaminase [Paracoccaceae bacterium]MDE2916195.1 adenine deaminase [Paracoccaceae bacterium]